MKSLKLAIFLFISAFLMQSCANKKPETGSESKANILVEATRIITGEVSQQFQYVGKTTFFNKNTVASPISGYVAEIKIVYGQKVIKGDLLFSLLTKEEKALTQSFNSGLNTGSIDIHAPTDGYISELSTFQSGAYVQEGNTLCVITQDQHPAVLVQIPYAEKELFSISQSCELKLSDEKTITGTLRAFIPLIEPSSQTITAIIQPIAGQMLPENMMVSAIFTLPSASSLIVPKDALFANETLSDFWVISLLNDSLAIHIPVECSTENDSLVSINSPYLSEGDWVITKGGYGLADSTIVSRTK